MAQQELQDSMELLEAQSHIWNHVFNFINSMSLKCAVELAIPDVIHKHGRPMTLAELVDALNPGHTDRAKVDALSRLMRILVHSGFFRLEKTHSSDETQKEDAGYTLTPASRLLVGDHSSSMKSFVLSQLDPILMDPWHHLSHWFQTTPNHQDRTVAAFAMANKGISFWEKKDMDPRFSCSFDEGMARDTPIVASVIARDPVLLRVFDDLESLVDVGGGTGTLATAIAQTFPHIQCTVLDVASVIAGLKEPFSNLKYVQGNMFECIPPSDAVLLKWILHDWSDEDGVRILKKCKEAITTNKEKKGKVIIIEMVLDEHCHRDHKSVETQLFLDLLMMTIVGGRERQERDWARLFSDAGFSDYTITPALGLRSIIEVYP